MGRVTVPVRAELGVHAPPAAVRAVLLEWRQWPSVFPKIHAVTGCAEQEGEGVITIDVSHEEGTVRNWLRPVDQRRVDLIERKRRYRAHFIFSFLPAGCSSRLVVTGRIEVPRWVVVVKPLIQCYAHRQLLVNTLRPLATAASRRSS
jgi:hypothetical protein